MLLEVRNLTVHYYTAMVLNEASFSVDTGELVAVVGPNGAGKTTLLRAIAGLTRWERDINRGRRAIFSNIVTTGEVYFEGRRIDNVLTGEHRKEHDRLVQRVSRIEEHLDLPSL